MRKFSFVPIVAMIMGLFVAAPAFANGNDVHQEVNNGNVHVVQNVTPGNVDQGNKDTAYKPAPHPANPSQSVPAPSYSAPSSPAPSVSAPAAVSAPVSTAQPSPAAPAVQSDTIAQLVSQANAASSGGKGGNSCPMPVADLVPSLLPVDQWTNIGYAPSLMATTCDQYYLRPFFNDQAQQLRNYLDTKAALAVAQAALANQVAAPAPVVQSTDIGTALLITRSFEPDQTGAGAPDDSSDAVDEDVDAPVDDQPAYSPSKQSVTWTADADDGN
jgi:hypothetical protein